MPSVYTTAVGLNDRADIMHVFTAYCYVPMSCLVLHVSIGVNFLQIVGGGAHGPFLPLPFPSLSCLFLPSLPLSLEVGPPNPAGGLGERCKLPKRGLGAEIELGAF